MKTSSYSGFFKLDTEARMREVAEFAGLSIAEQEVLRSADSLDMDKADHMVENVIGRFALPMGVAINFIINGKDVVIPMVTEEPSVIAACSNAAKMARAAGGFTASTSGNIMIAQIQMLRVPAPFAAKSMILEKKEASSGGYPGRHGRKCGKHHGRNGFPLHRGADRRHCGAADFVQSGGQACGAGKSNLEKGSSRRRRGGGKNSQRLCLCGGRPLSGSNSQQRDYERNYSGGAGNGK